MNENSTTPQNQTLTLTNRNILTLTGVTKVHSVKDDLAQLETNQGSLQVVGKDLELTKLEIDKGEVQISGTINSLKYGEKSSGFLKKLFK